MGLIAGNKDPFTHNMLHKMQTTLKTKCLKSLHISSILLLFGSKIMVQYFKQKMCC